MVVERRKWRPLPAQPHVRRAEIPDDRQAKGGCQNRSVARLMGAATNGVMGQRLAVEADKINVPKSA